MNKKKAKKNAPASFRIYIFLNFSRSYAGKVPESYKALTEHPWVEMEFR